MHTNMCMHKGTGAHTEMHIDNRHKCLHTNRHKHKHTHINTLLTHTEQNTNTDTQKIIKRFLLLYTFSTAVWHTFNLIQLHYG
jgi:hypothetical protein